MCKTKVCNKCKIEFPLTLEFFNSHGVGKFLSDCKTCRKLLRRVVIDKRKTVKTDTRTCSRCKIEKNLNLVNFYIRRNRGSENHPSFGLICKSCIKVKRAIPKELQQKQGRKATGINIPILTEDASKFKTCTKCHTKQPQTLEFFRRHKAASNGLSPKCRLCDKQHTIETAEQRKIYYLKRYQDPEYVKRANERAKQYRQSAITQTSYLEVLAVEKSRVNKHKNKNPELFKAKSIARAESRRARAVMAEGSHNHWDILELVERQKEVCIYCGIKLTTKTYSVDHVIPLSKGGNNFLSNLAICCKKCNSSKLNRTPEEWTSRWYQH